MVGVDLVYVPFVWADFLSPYLPAASGCPAQSKRDPGLGAGGRDERRPVAVDGEGGVALALGAIDIGEGGAIDDERGAV